MFQALLFPLLVEKIIQALDLHTWEQKKKIHFKGITGLENARGLYMLVGWR